MAKKRTPRPKPAPKPAPAPAATAEGRSSVTKERFIRLHKFLQLLAAGPQTRAALTKRLSLDVRGFYRDLELLRKEAGIPIDVDDEGRYVLGEDAATATARLPYPDPLLTLGEMRQLARGRSAVHKKLQGQIDELLK